MVCFDTSEAPSTATAQERLQLALAQIEAAQQLLGGAAANLSPIIGLVKEHEATMKLYDRVHALWFKCRRWVGSSLKLDR